MRGAVSVFSDVKTPVVVEYEHSFTVTAGDIDQQGHVNNVRYVQWIQDVAVAHWQAWATPEQLEGVTAVITIAANLDIDAWAKHHNYLPLSESKNPALSTRPHPWIEIHIEGTDDDVVPSETRDAYFERYPSAQRWLLEKHGHKCCWVEEWKELWERVEAEIQRAGVTGDGQN